MHCQLITNGVPSNVTVDVSATEAGALQRSIQALSNFTLHASAKATVTDVRNQLPSVTRTGKDT